MTPDSPTAIACLAKVSVVRIASAASGPPSALECFGGRVDAGKQLVHRQELADQPGAGDGHLTGAAAEELGDVLGGVMGVAEPARAGAGIGPAGIEYDGAQPAARRAPGVTTGPARPAPGCSVKTPAAA